MRPELFTRARTLYVLTLLGLAALAIKPLPPLEYALELAFVPTRLLPELTVPMRWLRAGEVRAAERTLGERAASSRERAERLFADEQDAALPTRAELRLGRRFVHGEVVGRGANDLDEVIVHLASLDGIEAGMPVVVGDHYVGRVSGAYPDHPGSVRVELVTGDDFFVGAKHREGETATTAAELVVGGLAPRVVDGHRGIELAVHNPSQMLRTGGEVRVFEPRFPAPEVVGARFAADRWAELASGFLLGELELVQLPGGGQLARVRPRLDYQGGLFQVLVLLEADGGPRERRLELETFDARAWRAVSALTAGELSPARAGRRFAIPPNSGLEVGAAIAFGGHLLGRLVRVGLFDADARLLGDPGSSWAVLARLEGEQRPLALGEWVSLGRRRADGALLFRWDARVAVGGEGPPLRAELFTGSGLRGVPRGLRIGSAELPRELGRHLIVVQPEAATRRITRCLAWGGVPREEPEQLP